MEVTEHEYILGSMDCVIAHNAVSSPAPAEANALFSQIVKHSTPFLGLQQSFHTLPIIWAHITPETFWHNPRCGPLK
jgi:hypothetical protein